MPTMPPQPPPGLGPFNGRVSTTDSEDPFPHIRPSIPAPSTSAAPSTSTAVSVPGASAHSSRLTRNEAWEAPQHRIDDERISKGIDIATMASAVARMSKTSLKDLISSATASVESTEAPAENFHVERKIRSTLRDWAILISVWAATADPEAEFTRELMWRSEYVLKFAPVFLTLRVMLAKGHGGGQVKAVTVFNWSIFLVRCIIRYTRNEHGHDVGADVLLKKKLYPKIKQTVKKLIKDHQLDRARLPKVYYGRWEVTIMLNTLLRITQFSSGFERLVKLQTCCMILICFYTMARPGSLAPASEEYTKRDLLLLLGDVQIHLVNGIWNSRVVITLRAWKGEGESVVSTSRTYTLDSVSKAHNIAVDPTVYIICYMLCRGAFGPKFKTIEDLEAAKNAVLRAVPDKAKEPFFLAITFGGHDLVQGQPLNSTSVSHIIKSTAVAAGLPPAGATALRRDAGNDYATKVGVVTATTGMGHRHAGRSVGGATATFHQHYSRGTADMPWVGVRTGELEGRAMDDVTRRQLQTQNYMRAAVDAIVNISASPNTSSQTGEPPQGSEIFNGRTNLSTGSKEKLLLNDNVTTATQIFDSAWAEFFKNFPPEAKTYKHTGANTRVNVQHLLDRYGRRFDSPKAVMETAISLYEAIEGAGEARKKESRRLRRADAKAINEARADVDRPHNTYENRQAAMEQLENTGRNMVKEAASRQLAPAAPQDLSLHTSLRFPLNNSSAAQRVPTGINAALAQIAPSATSWDDDTFAAEAPLALLIPPEIAEDISRVQEIQDESLAAPTDMENQAGWKEWQSSMEDVREHNDARSGAADEEYSLLADQSLVQEISFIERQSRKGKGGLHDDERLFGNIWKEAGVPSCATFQKDSVIPNQAEDDETPDDEAEEISENVELETSDKEEVNMLGLPEDQLRALYARDLLNPLKTNSLIQEYFKSNDNRWICPLCRDFTHSDAPNKAWPGRPQLEHHMRIHTPWHDLEVQMAPVNGGDGYWNCPSCPAKAGTLQAIRSHCVTQCPDKDQYLQMQKSHQEDTSRDKYVETRRTNVERSMRAKGLVQEAGWEPDYDDDLARRVRELFLDVRNWDIEAMVEEAISNGELGAEQRDEKIASLLMLREMSSLAWESTEFYHVPVKDVDEDVDEEVIPG